MFDSMVNQESDHPSKKLNVKTTLTTQVPPVVHPFFSSKPQPTTSTSKLDNFLPSPPSLAHFLHLDPFAHGSSSSSSTSKKIETVFYDLDGTLIKNRNGGSGFPTSRTDWMWWNPSVPERLKREWEEGKHLVVLSNQGGERPKVQEEWKVKLPLIAAKLPNIPIRILAAYTKDHYRKPVTGMFDLVCDLYQSKGYEVDMDKSVYLGDAAGRLASVGRRKDHGDTDYKMALNAGLRFLTPEEHFLGLPRPKFPEPSIGFHPRQINLNLPHIVPSNSPIAHKEIEMVIFVGPPASGKTTFFKTHFYPRYQHIDQDILKFRERCLRVAEESLSVSSTRRQSVVIDNTNRNRATRALYIALANKLNVPIRCFYFNTPTELAKHNDVYRAFYCPDEKRTLLPGSAFVSYERDYERPTEDEGFDELRTVDFVWEGDESQRRLWERYVLEVK